MKLQVVAIPFILLSVFSACGLAQETELLTIKKIGTRTLEYGKRSYSFPWYHVKADHNQIWFGKVWSRIPPVPGTKTAYIGSYGDIEVIDLSFDGHMQAATPGLSLLHTDEKRRLKVGPGKVYIRALYFEESKKQGPMRFQGGRDYVICLDREPVGTFKNINGEAGCDLDTELEHVIGVIEVEHTYDWRELPDWNQVPINDNSFVSFRVNRTGFDKPDISVTKGQKDRHEVANREGTAIGSDVVIDRLLYGLRSCKWRVREKPFRFQRWPTVTQSKLVVKTAGTQSTLTMLYDNGAWIMDFNGKQYQAAHPVQLFDVHHMIERLVRGQ